MEWIIPGTVLRTETTQIRELEQQLDGMFLAGGMVLSQVAQVTGLEPHTIQNWVKRGYLTSPVKKRYTHRQLCRILIINMLRSALPLDRICGLLQYVNGHLDDEADDLIDDTQLYGLFLRLVVHHRQMHDGSGRDAYLQEVLACYQEPVPGARQRVEQVLRIMLTAWAASQLRQKAEAMIGQLNDQ